MTAERFTQIVEAYGADPARWPEAELVDDWSQGAPLKWIKDICGYWERQYDWRQREAQLAPQPAPLMTQRRRQPRSTSDKQWPRRRLCSVSAARAARPTQRVRRRC